MSGPCRITSGRLTDPGRTVNFTFDGRALRGLGGDTLASALLANGVRLLGRSFKYHRPRGAVTCGPEEPCALVDVLTAGSREPNVLATTLPLYEGLCAESQNRWPSLRFDLLALNDFLGRFLPAGFYYKTFMAPGWAWEKVYEPLIRRAAGLGRLGAIVGAHAAPADTVHQHTDVLIIGSGAAGLSAARALAAAGARVLLLEQDVVLGGGTWLDERWHLWREGACAGLAGLPQLRCLTRTAALGAYGHGVFGALETLTPEESLRLGGLRERLHVIRTQRVLIATGATERLVAFSGNDVPGVMLAGAALGYLRRYGVAVAEKPALFANSDEAYEALFALHAAGIRCAAAIDAREDSPAADRARALGIEVLGGSLVEAVEGREAVRGVRVARQGGREAAHDPLRWPADLGRLLAGHGAGAPGGRPGRVARGHCRLCRRAARGRRRYGRRRTRRVRPGRRGSRWCAGRCAHCRATRARSRDASGRRRRPIRSAHHCCPCGKSAARARRSWTCRTTLPRRTCAWPTAKATSTSSI